MEVEIAQQRAEAVAARFEALLQQRQAMIAAHEGERLYPYVAGLYPESLRWTGRAALTTLGAVREMVIIGPTLFSNRIRVMNKWQQARK